MNIVDDVNQFLGRDVVDRIGSMLGMGQDKTRTAVNAAVPSLLAGMTGVSSTTEGSRKLMDAIDQQDEGMLGNLAGFLGGRGESLMSQGSSLLNSLMGKGMLPGIANGLSKFTGLGGNAISSLLGVLTPVVLGTLKQEKTSLGLGPNDMASLLASQKGNIAAAMPSGLASALGNVPGVSDVVGYGRQAAGAAYSAGRQAVAGTASAARSVATAGTTTGNSVLRWLLPLIVLALIAWALISWLSHRTVSRPVTPAPSVAPLGSSLTNLTSDFRSTFDSVTRTFSGITDEASAQQALPKIQEFNSRLDALHGTWNQLATSERGTISNLVSSLQSSLKPEIDRVMAIPGVSNVLKPAVDSMTQKINSFGGP